jgi:hypothetical protein
VVRGDNRRAAGTGGGGEGGAGSGDGVGGSGAIFPLKFPKDRGKTLKNSKIACSFVKDVIRSCFKIGYSTLTRQEDGSILNVPEKFIIALVEDYDKRYRSSNDL